jgi:hypothetical protein
MPRSTSSFASLVALCVANAATALAAATPSVIELTTADGVVAGRSLGHNADLCWIAQDDGAIRKLALEDVTAARHGSDRFRPATVVTVRDRMRKEFGRRLEVVAQGQYVVCAPRGMAKEYADLLNDVHASFTGYFSRRRFDLDRPEFPLVVLVFPNRREFEEYAEQDKTPASATLKGYYHRLTNRIALYVDETVASTPAESSRNANARDVASSLSDASVRDTLVHEATHQLAFNTGLHSRIGETPLWVIEGLAMLFEEDSRRDDSASRSAKERINRSRYLWFMSYRQERRPPRALPAFIEGDDPFRAAALDGYSEGWALSFYLAETRPTQYSKYLRAMASRDPLRPYNADERRGDFLAAFGKDLAWFEGQYLLYLDKLQ